MESCVNDKNGSDWRWRESNPRSIKYYNQVATCLVCHLILSFNTPTNRLIKRVVPLSYLSTDTFDKPVLEFG